MVKTIFFSQKLIEFQSSESSVFYCEQGFSSSSPYHHNKANDHNEAILVQKSFLPYHLLMKKIYKKFYTLKWFYFRPVVVISHNAVGFSKETLFWVFSLGLGVSLFWVIGFSVYISTYIFALLINSTCVCAESLDKMLLFWGNRYKCLF